MALATQEQCLQYFEDYKVPKNIKAHCLAVQNTSLFLATELNKKGENINVEMVRSLSILHDLFKVVVLEKLGANKYHQYTPTPEEIEMHKKLRAQYKGMYESQVAYEVFKDEFPKMALSLKRLGDPYCTDKKIEELIVHYVDQRMLKDQLVTLQERGVYLDEVYGKSKTRDQDHARLLEFETEIFTKLGFAPTELMQRMKNEPN